MPGLFVVIEGIDGSGKSTLLSSLEKKLRHLPVVTFCEPTRLPSGIEIRRHLAAHSQLSQEAWLELFTLDRQINADENVLPGLKAGKIVLLDRYYYSTAAYQGGQGARSAASILAEQRQMFREPDLLFFLDLAPEAALARLQRSRTDLEVFETSAELIRIYANYQEIIPECEHLDAGRSADEIAEAAARVIQDAFKNSMKSASADAHLASPE